ncbi:hypothetical protein AAP_00305 [Ascosphaera apis ARSEF 7405]|uniref:Uncharacterized protein n=1 Tax=Ascosphaera apis ARSEF 7405 TaxID=392613 RepID=A0A168DRZ9_9EURO|nr:hypothetical protein AAP_00305 [Ascosphaera apis ARSEF 7405]
MTVLLNDVFEPEAEASEGRATIFLAICITVTAITAIIIPMRFYVHFRVTKSVRIEDWMVLFGAVSICNPALALIPSSSHPTRYNQRKVSDAEANPRSLL